MPLVSKLQATNAPKGLAALTHLKTVSDDGIVVVRRRGRTIKSEIAEKPPNRLFGRDRTDN